MKHGLVVAADTETTGLRPFLGHHLHRAAALGTDNRWTWLDKSPASMRHYQHRLNQADLLVGHNIKFDAHMLAAQGVSIPWERTVDTILMAALLCDQENKSLLGLSLTHLDYDGEEDLALEAWLKQHRVKREDFSKIPDKVLEPYTRRQLTNNLCLWALWQPTIDRHYSELYRNEMRLSEVLMRMERRGVPVDGSRLHRAHREIGLLLEQTMKRLYRQGAPKGLKPTESQQIGEWLHSIGYRLPRTPKGKQYSTGKDILQEYTGEGAPDALIDDVLRARSLAKLMSTYLEGLAEQIDPNGIVHTTYSQHITRTGRLSSQDPNLQNIPTEEGEAICVKRAFRVREGYDNFSLDFKSIELVMANGYTGDLAGIALAEAGQAHIETALFMYGAHYTLAQKLIAKAVNFGRIYGAQLTRIARLLKGRRKPTKADLRYATDFLRRYDAKWPGIAKFKGLLEYQLRENGYVTSCYGRRYHVPWRLRHKAFNAITQGGVADMVKHAMVQLDDILRTTSSGLLLQIHDELVLEIDHREGPELLRELVLLAEAQVGDRLPIHPRVGITRWNHSWAAEVAIDRDHLVNHGRIRYARA